MGKGISLQDRIRSWITAAGCGVVLCSAGPLPGGEWDVEILRYRPYLTLESVRDNYGFEALEVKGRLFELRSPFALINGALGDRALRVNRLVYYLNYPPERKGDKYLVSAYDVTNLLDLTLRPGAHLQPQLLTKVYIQPTYDEWSTNPDARSLAFQTQEALGEYGIIVRFLEPSAIGVIGDGLTTREEGATAWIRLRGNGKLPFFHCKTQVLAPPESPARQVAEEEDPNEVRNAVYFGNLHDAESLALATLIQTGLAFGPGAVAGQAIDAGIHQVPVPGFERSAGAAVEVQWGAEVAEEHIIKAIVAGILRYRAFLVSAVARAREMEETREHRLQIVDSALQWDAAAKELVLQVSLARKAPFDGPVDKEALELQAFVFAGTARDTLDLMECPPPEVRWQSVLPEWSREDPEELELRFRLGASPISEARSFGHVVRLVEDGVLQDVKAQPQGLLNQLWRFTAVYPP